MPVISFTDQENRPQAPMTAEETVAWLREMREGEEIRLLLGDLFMRVAASEPVEEPTPYRKTMERLLENYGEATERTLGVTMDNLDYLRQYEILMDHKRKLRRMLEETDHGWAVIRKNREREKEFREILSRPGRNQASGMLNKADGIKNA